MNQITSNNLSPTIQEFLEKYRDLILSKPSPETVAKIHVDEIASKIAGFYNYLRNIVDYREEHLLRKGIIERTLKRYLTIGGQNIADPFLKEIIRSGRLPNDTIPETKPRELQKIIDKYLFFFKRLSLRKEKNKKEIYNWLIKICACELEEKIDPPTKDELLAELMLKTIKERLVIQGKPVSEETKNIQLFISIQKKLLRTDESQLNYRLLRFLYINWADLTAENILPIAETIPLIYNRLQQYLNDPLSSYFTEICDQYNTLFYLIGDIVYGSNNPDVTIASFENTAQVEKMIKVAYQKRYDKEKGKLGRLAFFSIVSFFLSKILIALFIEVPLDKYLIHHFSWFNVVISILLPPLLMLLIVSVSKMPSEKNLKLVLEETLAIIFNNKNKKYLLKIQPSRPWISEVIVRIFYLITFVISFGLLMWLLLKIGFTIANAIILLFFTSLVAVTAVKIHNRSRELSIEKEKSSIFGFIIDAFSLPLVTAGRWAAYGLSRFNILALIFDLIIEVPLQSLVVFLENFRGFIKHKKEEIY